MTSTGNILASATGNARISVSLIDNVSVSPTGHIPPSFVLAKAKTAHKLQLFSSSVDLFE